MDESSETLLVLMLRYAVVSESECIRKHFQLDWEQLLPTCPCSSCVPVQLSFDLFLSFISFVKHSGSAKGCCKGLYKKKYIILPVYLSTWRPVQALAVYPSSCLPVYLALCPGATCPQACVLLHHWKEVECHSLMELLAESDWFQWGKIITVTTTTTAGKWQGEV